MKNVMVIVMLMCFVCFGFSQANSRTAEIKAETAKVKMQTEQLKKEIVAAEKEEAKLEKEIEETKAKVEATQKEIEKEKTKITAARAQQDAIYRVHIVDTNEKALIKTIAHCKGGVLAHATLVSGNTLLIVLLMDEKDIKVADMYRLAEICVAEHFKADGLKPAAYVVRVYTDKQYLGQGTFSLEKAYELVQKHKNAKPYSDRESQLLMPEKIAASFFGENVEDKRTVEE